MSRLTNSSHWIQVEEFQVQTVGQPETLAAVQSPFAAVTCSKRCAIAVLTAELPAEDAEKAEQERLFQSFGRQASKE